MIETANCPWENVLHMSSKEVMPDDLVEAKILTKNRNSKTESILIENLHLNDY
jgi:hypothetical protein